MTVKDNTEQPITNIVQLFPTNSDPGRWERLRKEYLYGKGPGTLISAMFSIWNRFRELDKRIEIIEDRLKDLDGISMPRHIARPPSVTEVHIDRFIPDDE